MNVKERVKNLCAERSISMNKLEEELGFGKGYISKLNTSNANISKLQKIADYFNVSVDYLLGNTEFKTKEEMYANWDKNMDPALPEEVRKLEEFNSKDNRDIKKKMNFILNELENYQEALMFDGEPLDDESRELLKASLENSIKTAKLLAKQKFNPNKNKK